MEIHITDLILLSLISLFLPISGFVDGWEANSSLSAW
jgi:hypothetical protein